MFIPTGWRDWELVMAALMWAWFVLGLTSLLAFGIAYGLFRAPHRRQIAGSSTALSPEVGSGTSSPAAVVIERVTQPARATTAPTSGELVSAG
ncbi:MAG: hypothetical protein NZ703_05970 [Gemmataceae bacterium]|nr:hypothetical protein [Gemmataceae bacterium]MCS7270614.1 hypothetical protein [Gemmataceae bacterium]MDW8243877.1 hypothetical protein [Thermogemmata sp.]